jgi:uncharacterized protein (DUF433 family)
MIRATNGTGIVAFSAHQVSSLTRLSLRQLSYWDSTGFFSPEYAPGYSGAFCRVYSFRDVVGLYTIGLLRKEYGFPLQKLRKVGEYLHRYHETPWASLALFVTGREIVFRDPANPSSYLGAALDPGQSVIAIELKELARRVDTATRQLRARRPAMLGKITRNRYVVHNAPVLAGTRIPTAAVWELHTAGYSERQILREYPRLRVADIESALSYESRKRRLG